MMSDVRYEIKTPLPVIWLETVTQKIRVGPYVTNTNTTNWSWLIRLKMRCWRDSSTDWSSKRLTIRSKEMEDYYSLILIYIVIDHHFTLHWLWQLYQIFLMWSQIYFLLSIRLTGGQQIDFKDLKPLKAKKIFF